MNFMPTALGETLILHFKVRSVFFPLRIVAVTVADPTDSAVMLARLVFVASAFIVMISGLEAE